MRAELDEKRGDVASAAEFMRRAAEDFPSSPDRPQAALKYARMLEAQGKVNEARTVFQGLYAVNPMDPYFAKALGVVEMAAGNPAGAVAAYDVALKLAPTDAQAWLGRAEVRLLQGAKAEAVDNLRKAQQHAKPESPENQKVSAMLQALSKK